ncbi:MAG: protein kinase [bacterium]|nr:protein kinase [bacterium]
MTMTSDTEETQRLFNDSAETQVIEADIAEGRTPTQRFQGVGLALQFFVLAAGLLVITLSLTVAVAAWRANRVADETIRRDLARVPEVFSGYASTRATAALEQVRSLALEPGTMAIFAEEVDLSTRMSYAVEDAPNMLSEGSTFFLFDRYSRVLARSDRPDGRGVGQPFAAVGWVASVLDDWQGVTAFIRERGSLAVVGSAPVITGEGDGARLEGVLAVTFPFEDAALRQLQALTRGELIVVLDMARRGEPPAPEIGGSTAGEKDRSLFDAVFGESAVVETVFADRTTYGPVSIDVQGRAEEIIVLPIENFDGDVFAALIVARSRIEEMASFYAIRRGLMIAGAIMLLLSLPVSFVLGRRIARPISQLAMGAEAIRDGQLNVELPATASGEVGMLAGAFNAMIEELKEKQALEQLLVDLKAQSKDTGFTAVVRPPSLEISNGLRLPKSNEIFGERYRIRGELGRGGMGVVYRATDMELDEDVALKVLKPEAFTQATEGVAKLRQEVRLARRISHPNVIRVHDLVEADGLRCLSMEYVPGTTLLEVIEQHGKLGLAPGLQVAKQMCRGLAAVHTEGIVHRDLKPQNIMVLPNGVVKLMDFGISSGHMSGEDSDRTTLEGTPAYMSPEMCRGEDIDHRSDLYSLGVVFWEMFAGEMPFQGMTLGALLKKHLHEPAPNLRSVRPELPEALDALVSACLDKNPDQRPPSVNAVYQTLRDVLVTDW